eukprot:375371-Amphidinium_carterae.1
MTFAIHVPKLAPRRHVAREIKRNSAGQLDLTRRSQLYAKHKVMENLCWLSGATGHHHHMLPPRLLLRQLPPPHSPQHHMDRFIDKQDQPTLQPRDLWVHATSHSSSTSRPVRRLLRHCWMRLRGLDLFGGKFSRLRSWRGDISGLAVKPLLDSPGPRPPFSIPSRCLQSTAPQSSPSKPRGSPRHTGASGRALSYPPHASQSRRADVDDDTDTHTHTHSAPVSLPRSFDAADVLIVGWQQTQTIEEFRTLVPQALRVPHDYEVRTPRLFSQNVVIRCSSVDEANAFISRVRAAQPKDSGAR